MLPFIQIGPAAVQSAIVALVAGLVLGGAVAERECKRCGLGDAVWNVIAVGVAAALITARFFYIVQNPAAYASDWRSAFALTPGALSMEHGLVFGGIAASGYLQHRGIPLARFADAAVPGLLVTVACVAAGQFLSGDAYGEVTDVAWAIPLWGELRHPVQLYDASAALAGLGVLWLASRWHLAPGAAALTALAWYSGARVVIDAYRGDPALLLGEYRASQVVALIVLLAALWGLSRLQARRTGNEGLDFDH
ncbi:MAG: prolipoprotein diacylglyceryl transferase [Chloroflexi bacterium]|nr:prolipoprotein diacylglyceryl transferase [Chloroflexota bacterium]